MEALDGRESMEAPPHVEAHSTNGSLRLSNGSSSRPERQ
jgi:hypothetical protein